MSKTIHILGAGLAGMIAAIDLTRKGHEVLVLDKARGIGGAGPYHPSIHGTPIDIKKTSEYVGLDLSPFFQPFSKFRCYFGKKGYDIIPDGFFGVERGSRKTSIDTFLYNMAIKQGVKFEFNRDINNHRELPPGSIIATGQFPEMYQSLKVPSSKFYGYGIRFKSDKSPDLVAIFDNSYGDYYYHGIMNGICFGLLFQRSPVPKGTLNKCRDFLEEVEGYPSLEWIEMHNSVPFASYRNPRLFSADKILSGNLSGMQEPMMMFGIVGAIFSGKISAMAVYDRENAVKEFKAFTKNWTSNYFMRKIFEKMPLRDRIAEGMLIKAPERIKRFAMESDRMAIPGVVGFPIMRTIGKIK